MQNGIAIMESCLEVSYKLKDILTYGPGIPLLGIYPKEMKTYAQTKAAHRCFLASLFIIIQNWKWFKCHPMDER